MNYKSIIRSRKIRYRILNFLAWIPDKIMIKIQYRLKFGFWPNFKKPQRFSEKIQLYKLYYRNDDLPQCVDKNEVRQFVEKKGLESILNELYGVYYSLDEICLSDLPQKFVVKSTSGGGGLDVLIVKNKDKISLKFIKSFIDSWTKHKQGQKTYGREWAYSKMKDTRIIIEKYIEGEGDKNGLTDYKIFCFNGSPYCVQVDHGRFGNHKQNFYDMNWNPLGVHCSYPEGDNLICPKNFDKMKEIAKLLSENFPFVRVDLYNIDGSIVFGELTFYPSSGYGKFHPDQFDFELGKLFTFF